VTGLWHPLAPRESRSASIPFRSVLDQLLDADSDEVRVAAMQAMAKLGIDTQVPRVFALVGDRRAKSAVRVAALHTLRDLKDSRLPEALQLALDSEDELLRNAEAQL
jgi:HEAT repeat protein